MKKLKLSIIFIVATILLFGCGGDEIPEDMHPDTYKYGVQALEIMEKYNSGDLSKDGAKERIDALSDVVRELNLEDEDENISLTYSITNSSVLTYIDEFSTAVTFSNSGTGYFSDYNTYEAEKKLRKELELDED